MSDTGQIMRWSTASHQEAEDRSGLLDLPYLPGKESFAQRLEEVVTRLDLSEELYKAFPIKRPAPSWWAWWFGFWMDSPLTQSQCRILHVVFTELAKKSPLYRDRISPFMEELQLSRDSGMPLYVKLGTPGHYDFGWETTFAHCPHCKAEAPVERWQEHYPDEDIECPVCGYSYSPAKTYSQTEG